MEAMVLSRFALSLFQLYRLETFPFAMAFQCFEMEYITYKPPADSHRRKFILKLKCNPEIFIGRTSRIATESANVHQDNMTSLIERLTLQFLFFGDCTSTESFSCHYF